MRMVIALGGNAPPAAGHSIVIAQAGIAAATAGPNIITQNAADQHLTISREA